MGDGEQISFNVNAELYENDFGELAVKVPGGKVFRNIGLQEGARFQKDVVMLLEENRRPTGWSEMPSHELSGGRWQCIARLGYLNGDPTRPGFEFEGDREKFGSKAKSYLADAGLG